MGRIHHVNVVRLVGFCADGVKRALIYEFLPNESLEKYIFSKSIKDCSLSWEKLQNVALGIAKGIEYLHQAKLCSKEQSAVSMTTARGTMGYIAPEVLSRNFGNVSYKSDIYSFGMLLLEMVGGRKNIDVTMEKTSQVYFPEWVYNQLDQGEDVCIRIVEDGDTKIAKKLTIVGLWCIQWYPIDRPSMKVVIQMLEGGGNNLTMPPNPFASIDATRTNT
uniref:Protein kinase domain-containing protein n=1 Tax=Vitis vinifera TaxID=29760 RepID=F6I2Q8_VITVI